MDVRSYLTRIGYDGTLAVHSTTLRRLHRRHMQNVPFENLDIHLHRPIVLDEAALYDKVVRRRRGGFCYELNGLFAWLLRELGFTVELLSARVTRDKGGFGPDFDHMTLLVELDEPWIADVGFGDSFVEPLRLQDAGPQRQESKEYLVRTESAGYLVSGGDISDPKPMYAFDLQPRRFSDFADMCRYHQTSRDSPFTQKRVCSRLTADGRVTLSDLRLIHTRGGERQERVLESEEEFRSALKRYFDIELGSATAA